MALEPGTRIATYEILHQLGAGGMGEVYAAKDARLGRQVAIKVLPAALATDADRLMRFEREAQAVAALSHPNILSIYDFGRDGTIVYAVMELLEGETLRQRLDAGPIPLRKAIDCAVQIARGLASAHDNGIAHRDLKPDNVFITRDERVKILDFGLAKALEAAPVSATLANTGATVAGTVLGTVGYMAPEQVRGQNVDHRADIFAFGALLYEMVTGRRAFSGDTAADTMSAILNAEPADFDPVTLQVPPALERIIRRCLEKKPDRRFQSAQDLAFALETLTQSSSSAALSSADLTRSALHAREAAAAAPRFSSRLPWAIAAGAVLLASAAILWTVVASPPAAPRWGQYVQVTDAADAEGMPALSPDGTTVAFATRAAGTWDIYVQRVGGRNRTPIAADPDRDEAGPAFSPDGNRIAFHEADDDGGIFIVGATGEAPRRLTEFGFDAAWSPDGSRIAFSRELIENPASRQTDSGLWVVEAGGAAPPRLIEGTGDAVQPAWSPSGERLVYWSNTGGQRDLYSIAAAGGERVSITADAALDWAPEWTPDGMAVVFASDRGGSMNLWRIPVDQATGQPRGEAVPVTAGVQSRLDQPSLSRDGSRIAFRSHITTTNPVAIPFDSAAATAGQAVILINSSSSALPGDISPDGSAIVYSSQGDRQEDLYISNADGSQLRRLTDDDARDRGGEWAPDGRSIYFYSNRDGRWAAWRIGRDGGNLQKVAGLPGLEVFYPNVSPDGRLLVAAGLQSSYIGELTTTPVALRPLENAALEGDLFFYAGEFSPDSSRLFGSISHRRDLSASGVALYELATRTVRRLNEDRAYNGRWLPDGRRVVYFTTAGELVLLDTVSLERRGIPVRLPLPPAPYEAFALSPDGRRIIYSGIRSESDIWVVDQAR